MGEHVILFLAANPLRSDRIALDREAREIQLELERTGHRDQFVLETRWAAQPLDLLRAVRRLRPTVVHFSGHGAGCESGHPASNLGAQRDAVTADDVERPQSSGVYFEGRDRQPQLVSSDALKDTFGAVSSMVTVVVFNACYSDGHADALLAHVDCVIGMQGSITDDAARSFAIGFYGALGDGESIAAAFRQGCAAVNLEALRDSDRPRLKVRSGVDAAQLVLADRRARTTATTTTEISLDDRFLKRVGRTMTSSGAVSVEVYKRLARMKREVAETLRVRPRALEQLVARIGCEAGPQQLADRLVELRGSEAAAHILAVSDDQPATSDGDSDRVALHAVLFAVLPYVSDWRDEVAACCARGERQPGVVELRYRSDTIAEAVMAGWVGRRCFFECKAGTEPYGVGAVQIPATAQTALFTSEQHLLEGVVKQLMYQLGVGGLNPHEQRTRVLAALRKRDERKGSERMRYYFLFRDAASPEEPSVLWHLARTTLHSEAGLPALVLVRMQGQLSDAEADLEACIAAMLGPRNPQRI